MFNKLFWSSHNLHFLLYGAAFLYIISYLILVMMFCFRFHMYLIHPSINNMGYLLGKWLCMKLKTVIVLRLSMFITKLEVFKIKLLTTRSWTNILVILTFTEYICYANFRVYLLMLFGDIKNVTHIDDYIHCIHTMAGYSRFSSIFFAKVANESMLQIGRRYIFSTAPCG